LEGAGVVPGGDVSRPRGGLVGAHTHSHVGGLVSRRNTGEEVGLTVGLRGVTGAKVSLAGGDGE
jgi:hypothetical protein